MRCTANTTANTAFASAGNAAVSLVFQRKSELVSNEFEANSSSFGDAHADGAPPSEQGDVAAQSTIGVKNT